MLLKNRETERPVLQNVTALFQSRCTKKVNIIVRHIAVHRTLSAAACDSSIGKAVPLEAWSGTEGSMKLRFPDFVTTAQEGGKVVSPMHRPPLPPGNTPGTHFC